jgi:hypothetical protein
VSEDRRTPQAKPEGPRGNRLEILVAAAIALVSLATAVAAWRSSDLSSKAGDAEREGLIEAVKEESLVNEDWRVVYEEAANAKRYLVAETEAEALRAGSDSIGSVEADALRQYLLPSLALLAGPLATDDSFHQPDGSLDLEGRYTVVHAETLGDDPPNPREAFARADRLHGQQRWIVVGTVLLAGSLFWVALGEIAGGRTRALAVALGLGLFAVGVLWVVGAELAYWVAGLVAL